MVNEGADEERDEHNEHQSDIAGHSVLSPFGLLLFWPFAEENGLELAPLRAEGFNALVIQPTHSNSCADAGRGGEDQKQTNHDRCKIHRQNCIDADEDDIVAAISVDVVKSDRCEEDGEVDIEEV